MIWMASEFGSSEAVCHRKSFLITVVVRLGFVAPRTLKHNEGPRLLSANDLLIP